MECMPRRIPRAEVDQGITQRDQFNTDEFPIAETLVREPHQNSLDGKSQFTNGPVRTRIRLVEPSAKNAAYWTALLAPLRPHLENSRLDLTNIDLSMPRILLIEDFGTTGLVGAYDDKDELNFSDFWRRFGLSHKKGGAGGRWGLGKLVFTSASAIGTLFGLTVRDNDPTRERLLMGQAILNNHKVASIDYAPHVFFAVPHEDGFQLPERNDATIQAFSDAAGISRTNEPGLSIAVICLRDGLEPDKLLPHVITNYYFPILTDRLVVEIDNKTISNSNFDELARAHGGPRLADGSLITFIRGVNLARQEASAFNLKTGWIKDGVAVALENTQVEQLRLTYQAGQIIHVRAPIDLRRKAGNEESTYVDLFLQKTPEFANGQALFVRGSITIPGEERSFRGRKSFGALLASDTTIVEFLGDAENPAHTRWVGSADKLKTNWVAPNDKVAAIKRVLNDLNELVTETENRIDETALIEFFSIPKPTPSSKKIPPTSRQKLTPPPPPQIPQSPRAFNVTPKLGGFLIKGNPLAEVSLPYQLRVVTAYGVRRGNPFKKYKRQDFDLRSSTEIRTSAAGATWSATEPNVLLLDIATHAFRFEVSGFDTERDLELDVKR
jgi:hypothetical protein